MRTDTNTGAIHKTPENYERMRAKLEEELTKQEEAFKAATTTEGRMTELGKRIKDTQLLRAAPTERVEVEKETILREPVDPSTKAEAGQIKAEVLEETDKLKKVRESIIGSVLPPRAKGG